MQNSESPIGQKLFMIKDLQIFHKLNQFVDALVNLYLVLPRLREPLKTRYFIQSQTVSVTWAHGMVSSLCCWLLVFLIFLMIPDFCSDVWGGGIQSISAD